MIKDININPYGTFVQYTQIPLVQGDVRAYRVKATFKEAVGNAAVTITAIRPDGVVIQESGYAEGNTAYCVLPNNVYEVPGEVHIHLTITSENGNILTVNEVVADAVGKKEPNTKGEDRLPVLSALIAECQKLKDLLSYVNTDMIKDGAVTKEKLDENIANVILEASNHIAKDEAHITEEERKEWNEVNKNFNKAVYPGKNKVDVNNPDNVENDVYYDHSNGRKLVSEGRSAVRVMAVSPATTYCLSGYNAGQTYLTQWDSEGNFISGFIAYGTSKSFTAEANTAYIIVSLYTTSLGKVQIELGETATPYEPFKLYFNKDYIYEGLNDSILKLEEDFNKAVYPGKNKVDVNDPDNVENDVYYDHSNGRKLVSEGRSAVRVMAVSPATTYCLSGYNAGQTYLTQWDSEGNFISGFIAYGTSKSFTTEANTAYIIVSLYTTSLGKVQIELGETATPYEPFKLYFNKDYIYEGDLKGDADITRMTFAEEEKINLFNYYDEGNLFDKQIASNGGIYTAEDYFITHFIKISDISILGVHKSLRVSGQGAIGFVGYYVLYDADFNAITGRTAWANDTYTLDLTDSQAEYIRFTFYNADGNENLLMVYSASEAEEILPYTKYGYNIPLLNIQQANIAPSFHRWYGKKWVSIGDSNTSRRRYQSFVIDRLGLKWENVAAGGTDATYWADDERLEAVVARKPDVVTIMLGTNTGRPNGSLPTENIPVDYEWDKTTYAGAMCYIVSYIQKALPNCYVILITPPYAVSKADPHGYYTDGIYEKLEILKEMSQRYGCEFINAYNIASMWNYEAFFSDEGDGVHFNELYGARLANKIISKLVELEYVDGFQ